MQVLVILQVAAVVERFPAAEMVAPEVGALELVNVFLMATKVDVTGELNLAYFAGLVVEVVGVVVRAPVDARFVDATSWKTDFAVETVCVFEVELVERSVSSSDQVWNPRRIVAGAFDLVALQLRLEVVAFVAQWAGHWCGQVVASVGVNLESSAGGVMNVVGNALWIRARIFLADSQMNPSHVTAEGVAVSAAKAAQITDLDELRVSFVNCRLVLLHFWLGSKAFRANLTQKRESFSIVSHALVNRNHRGSLSSASSTDKLVRVH